MSLDKETQEGVSEANRIKQTMGTPGWEDIENRLDNMINEVVDIRNIPDGTPEEKLVELTRRQDAVALVEEWLARIKGDVINSQNIKIQDDLDEHLIIKK